MLAAAAAIAGVAFAPAAPPPTTILKVRPGQLVRMHVRPGGRLLFRVLPKTVYGRRLILSVTHRRAAWAAVTTFLVPNGRRAWVRVERRTFAVRRTRWRLTADLSARTVTVLHGARRVRTLRVAIGAPATPTPPGTYAITDKLAGAPFGRAYGCCILALSGRGHPRERVRVDPPPADRIGQVEGVRGVEREGDVEAEVAAHARGRLAAHVGLDAGDHDRPDPALAQPRLQARRPDEGGVDVLGHQQVGLALDDRLEGVSRMRRMQVRSRLGRVVADEDDRPSVRAPVREQAPDVRLAVGVVARAPTGVVEALPDVDEDEGCPIGREHVRSILGALLHALRALRFTAWTLLTRARLARVGVRASIATAGGWLVAGNPAEAIRALP